MAVIFTSFVLASEEGGSISLEVLEKPPGRGPEQPALDGPAEAEELDQMTSRGPIQPQPFCEERCKLVTMWKEKRYFAFSLPTRQETSAEQAVICSLHYLCCW